MTNPLIDIQEGTLNEGETYEVKAMIGTDGLTWQITDDKGRIIRWQSFALAAQGNGHLKDIEPVLRDLLSTRKELEHSFRSRHVGFSNAWATLLPARLFDATQLAACFKMLLPPGEYHYAYDVLPAFDLYVAYAVEPSVRRLADLYLPVSEQRHLATVLIDGFHKAIGPDAKDPMVCLHVRLASVQLAVMETKHLYFYNQFPTQTAEDVLYYTLLAYEQNRLDPAQTPLVLAGAITPDHPTAKVLGRAIKNLTWIRPNAFLPPGQTYNYLDIQHL